MRKAREANERDADKRIIDQPGERKVHTQPTPRGGGLAIFMLPRLLRTTLRGASYAMSGLILWNVALVVGVVELASGNLSGIEWLEMPRWVNLMLAVEGEFDLMIPQTEITPENFRSIASIEAMLERLLSAN